MNKKSNIYTRTGDLGTTALVGGTRVSKDDLRVEAYGTADELNSFIALLTCSASITADDHAFLLWLQHRLFDLGAYLATDNHGEMNVADGFGQDAISHVEHEIDRLDNELPPLQTFILPGGSRTSAIANVCRTVCRRLERRVVTLAQSTYVDPNVVRFINRVSDYLFVLGRHCNILEGTEEIAWQPTAK